MGLAHPFPGDSSAKICGGGGRASSPSVLTVSEPAAVVLMQSKPMKSTLLCPPLPHLPPLVLGMGSPAAERTGRDCLQLLPSLPWATLRRRLSSCCSCHPGNRSVLGENRSPQELKAKNSVGAATLALRSLLAAAESPLKIAGLGLLVAIVPENPGKPGL